MMKRNLFIILILVVTLLFVACSSAPAAPSESNSTSSQTKDSSTADASSDDNKSSSAQDSSESTADQEKTGILYVNFSNGTSEDPEDIKEYEFSYTGELTVEIIAQELTALTGLNFALSDVTLENVGAYIDWSPESSLIADLNDFTFKDNFSFPDSNSLVWFMLDSLNDSVIKNLSVSAVHYTSDGGRELMIPSIFPHATFEVGAAYQGSAYYAEN